MTLATFIQEIESIQFIRSVLCTIKKLFFAHCTCNDGSTPEVLPLGSYPDWCLHIKCRQPQCKSKKNWSVRMLCINNVGKGKRMYSPSDRRKHNEYHQKVKATIRNHQAVIISDVLPKIIKPVLELPSITQITDMVQNVSLQQNMDYYCALKRGDAMSFLMKKQFQSDNIQNAKISDADSEFHTLIAFLSQSQSKLENTKFANYFI